MKIKSNQVLLLEAGQLICMKYSSCGYKAYLNPEKSGIMIQVKNQHLWKDRFYSKGKVGGSSSINSMVYMRGHPLDYDSWENDLKLK